jgi:hypothetical protein
MNDADAQHWHFMEIAGRGDDCGYGDGGGVGVSAVARKRSAVL